MRLKSIYILVFILVLTVISCSKEGDKASSKVVTVPTTSSAPSQAAPPKYDRISSNMDITTSSPPVARKYKFPSIMVKEDMSHEDFITPDRKTTLRANLIVNGWKSSRDPYGRILSYASPELTYEELKEYLHFNDRDVNYLEAVKSGEPQAVIQTDWLTCQITFVDKIYNGKDESVKLKAVVIDNKEKTYSDKETAYRKNRGIIRRILDLFEVVHK